MDVATFSHYYERLKAERWSKWFSLQQEKFAPQEISTSAGLYRVAVMDNKGEHLLSLTYVGQTGRSLRERIQTLWREIYSENQPEDHPHVAAPAHWDFRRKFSNEHFQCSVFELPEMGGKDRREDREALESLAITLWRQQHGIYPLVNFGSCNGESMQERLEFVRAALSRMSLINLEDNDPWDKQWLLLPWSDWQSAVVSKQMKQRGIYRVRDKRDAGEMSAHRLEKIGFGVLAKGLSGYRPKQKDAPCHYTFSWFAPDWHDYQYHALCNDLVSAYVIFHSGSLSISNIAA